MLPGMTTYPAQPVRAVSGANKSLAVAWVLWLLLGIFGGHRFYLRKPVTGLIWAFTAGLLMFGWLFDAARINTLVRKVNARGY